MSVKNAGDTMVPLGEYPIVDSSATVLEAVIKLDESRRNTKPGRQPYQAVLVANKSGQIIGKLGQFALLKALEPKSRVSDDQDTLIRAGVSDTLMETALDHFRSFQQGLSEMCLGSSTLPVRSVMTPFREHVDKTSPICEVVHKLLEWHTLSVLVTLNNKPVGLVRLSDLCNEVIKQLQMTARNVDSEE